jgi:hypothetical protein
MIKIDGSEGTSLKIEGWGDNGGVAVISWRVRGGATHEQEVTSEQEAIHLLRKIESDHELTLISAQLRRRGIGPSG